jgi:hypothetical protein
MYPIILIVLSFECDSLEEKWHIGKFVFFREFRKYCFIAFSIFTSEIEWSSHPSKKYWDVLCLDCFDDLSQIFLYLSRVFSLKCIIGTDTEDDESKTPSIPLFRGR